MIVSLYTVISSLNTVVSLRMIICTGCILHNAFHMFIGYHTVLICITEGRTDERDGLYNGKQ